MDEPRTPEPEGRPVDSFPAGRAVRWLGGQRWAYPREGFRVDAITLRGGAYLEVRPGYAVQVWVNPCTPVNPSNPVYARPRDGSLGCDLGNEGILIPGARWLTKHDGSQFGVALLVFAPDGF